MSAHNHEVTGSIRKCPGCWDDMRSQRDALVAAGDVLATRLDETPWHSVLAPSERKVLEQRQQAVRAWLAVAHPGGTGHKP